MDIRFPIGLMFTAVGVILALFGLMSNQEIYVRSLNTNINLVWGVVLFIFGGVMLLLSWRSRNHPPGAANETKAVRH